MTVASTRCTARQPAAARLAALAWAALAFLPGAIAAMAPVPSEDESSPAQAPLHRWNWQTWSSESGLPQISVKSIVRDRAGLVWLATENGLARFDGTRFETFDPGNTPALAASWINRLQLDARGRVWIATLRNVAVFDGERFVGSADLGGVLALAPQGEAMLVGGDALWQAHLVGDRIDLAAVPGSLGGAQLLHADGRGSVWVGARGHGLRRRDAGGRWHNVTLPDAGAVPQAMAGEGERLWLGTDHGLVRLVDGHAEAMPLDGDRGHAIHALALDARGVLWIASYGELYRRFPDGHIETIPPQAPHAFPWTVSFFAEADGFWLGSQYHGVRHYWPSSIQRHGADEGLHDPSLWSFASDGERLLVGSNSGVAQWRAGRFTPWLDAEQLPHPAVYALLVDRQRQVWVGTRGGLVRVEADASQLHRFGELDGVQVNGAIDGDGGVVWLATAAGLLSAQGDDLVRVDAGTALAGQRVRALAYGRDGTLWIGAEGGVFRMRDGAIEAVPGAGLSGAFVTSVRALRDGRIAIGSYDRGIAIGGGADGTWQRFRRQHGLPSDTVFNLIAHDDALWVSFTDGLYRMAVPAVGAADPPRFDLVLLDEGERPGRSRVRCCNGAGNDKGALHQDALWLPSLNGAVRVPLDVPTPPPPMVTLTGATTGATPLAPAALWRLPADSRQLGVAWRSIDFRTGRQLGYRYRLAGFDADWVDAGARRDGHYARLPPGDYRFEVQARRQFQPWGPAASVAVQVPRRFVESWPFRLLLALAAVGLVALLVRWRLRHLEQQKQSLENTVQARTRELADANAKLKSLNRSLAEASLVDPLTGLRNRRFMPQHMPRLVAALARARTQTGEDRVLGLILVDADRFKEINDRHGHVIGDQVLCRLAEAMRAAVRDDDELIRWGGEEFLVVLPNLLRSELPVVAERIRHGIECSDALGGQGSPATASLGVAAWPIVPATQQRHAWPVALELADFALYRAKQAGRNRSVLIDLDDLAPDDWPDRPDGDDFEAWLAAGRIRLRVLP